MWASTSPTEICKDLEIHSTRLSSKSAWPTSCDWFFFEQGAKLLVFSDERKWKGCRFVSSQVGGVLLTTGEAYFNQVLQPSRMMVQVQVGRFIGLQDQWCRWPYLYVTIIPFANRHDDITTIKPTKDWWLLAQKPWNLTQLLHVLCFSSSPTSLLCFFPKEIGLLSLSQFLTGVTGTLYLDYFVLIEDWGFGRRINSASSLTNFTS